jgi:L-amino acid N-acyltransferase YncA
MKTVALDKVTIRPMTENDLEAIVEIDSMYYGAERPEYYREKLLAATKGSGINTSLVAEQEGDVLGFMIGSLYTGEFGIPETTANLDTIGIHPEATGKGVAILILEQFKNQIGKLGVTTLHTLVEWNDLNLILFFQRAGFAPSKRLSLELGID